MMGNYSTKEWIESTKDCHHTPKNLMRRLDSEFDPRSPSFEIQRTPIYVENFDESSSSLISSNASQPLEYDDANSVERSDASLSVTCSDPSMMISQLNFSETDSISSNTKIDVAEDKEMEIILPSPLTPVSVYTDEKEIVMSTLDASPVHKSISLTPISSNTNDPMFDVARKKLFNATRIGRKPLENVQNTSSPQKLLRVKHWRDFQEERAKLGIKLDENTPPPKFDGCASAPGKLAARRRPLVSSDSSNQF